MSLIEFTKDDLDYDVCRRAYYWTSFDPERRAKQEQDYYIEDMEACCKLAEQHITTEEQRQKAIELLEQYKIKILEKRRAYLYANSNTASAGIAGPANFNYERNRKKMAAADKRYQEFVDYKKRFEKILVKVLDNMTPQEVINNEIEKNINSMISEIAEDIIFSTKPECTFSISLLRANFRGRIETVAKNNPGKIDYIIEKIKEVETDKKVTIFTTNNKVWDFFNKLKEQYNAPKIEKESNSTTINGVEIVKNYELDRLQLFFNGKPDQEMITKLKKGAWHWSPSNKCWQRQLTQNAELSAKRILEV